MQSKPSENNKLWYIRAKGKYEEGLYFPFETLEEAVNFIKKKISDPKSNFKGIITKEGEYETYNKDTEKSKYLILTNHVGGYNKFLFFKRKKNQIIETHFSVC